MVLAKKCVCYFGVNVLKCSGLSKSLSAVVMGPYFKTVLMKRHVCSRISCSVKICPHRKFLLVIQIELAGPVHFNMSIYTVFEYILPNRPP
jgi:hypothetical protein